AGRTTVRAVSHRARGPPAGLEPRWSRDLGAICLKCLEKEPRRRYGSALELAQDLEAWLAGLPTITRPLTRRERFLRWCRRNPVLTGAAAPVVAPITIAFILITLSRNEAVELARATGELADANGELAKKEKKLADANGKLAEEKKLEATEAQRQKTLAQRQEKLADREATIQAFERGRNFCEQGEIARGMLLFGHALA